MIEQKSIFPFFTQTGIFFVGLSALLAILYVAQGILVPLVFGFIIAILLNPLVRLFIRFKINRIIAICITMLLTVIVIGAFIALIYTQAVNFSESWPIFVKKFTDILNQSIHSVADVLHIRPWIVQAWMTKTQHEMLTIDGTLIGETLISVGSGLAALFLIPVYVFVILYYQPLLIEFIHQLFNKTHQTQVTEIVSQTKSVVQHYLVGLLIEAVIVAVLNTAGLMLLGIQYAILLGVIGALLNVIPYIGGIISVGLFMIVALVTKDSPWFALYVLGVHTFVQIIDNNYIVPKIVASKVKINALFSILVVLIGNILWGIPGMFLSLPLLAIVKVIFDHIESMKPWGYLLGDTMPALKIKGVFKRSKEKEVIDKKSTNDS